MKSPAKDSAKGSIKVLGFGAAACAACCVGPLIGFIGAITIGTALAVFGLAGLLIAGIVVAFGVQRRRRSTRQEDQAEGTSTPILLTRRT